MIIITILNMIMKYDNTVQVIIIIIVIILIIITTTTEITIKSVNESKSSSQ